MSKDIKHGKDAQDAILRGIDFLADAVKVTEGPRGRNVILGQRALGQSPKVTKDGVTVSNYVDPSEPFAQIGADLIREAAQKTDNAVGDGTTASIVIAQAMIHEGFKLIREGANPMAIERDIREKTESIIRHVLETATKVEGEKIRQIATVSAHGDKEIGDLVYQAIEKAGVDGIATAEPSSTSSTYIETVLGLELEKSNLISAAFVTHPTENKAQWANCRILLWEGVIGSAKSIVPLLKQINQNALEGSISPVLIVAGGYEQEVLSVIITNRIKLALPIVAVRLDAYGERRRELLHDIGALVGGKVFTEDLGAKIENVKLGDLGAARKVVVDMRKTQIIEGKGSAEALQSRMNVIKSQMENTSGAELMHLKRRLAALLGGITVIKVGGVTVTEMEEKRDRVVDALSAAKAAVESGAVPGGGTALLRARSHALSTAGEGYRVLYEGCTSVARQIAENAGKSGKSVVLDTMLSANQNWGFNAATDTFEDLVASGIIDPAKVIVESLRNASAVACEILTMGAVVAERPETEKIDG